jgi:RND superfamily putative drug exporter
VFDRLAGLAIRWPRTVVLVSLVLIGLALFYGSDVTSRLQTGGQTDPGSDSALAAKAMEQSFTSGRPNLVLLVRAPDGVDSAAVAAEADRLASQLDSEPKVSSVVSYWQVKSPALRSTDGKEALIVAHVDGTEKQADTELDTLGPRYQGVRGPITVEVGGSAAVRNQVTSTVRGDISAAEAIGIPLTAFVLILVFRSFIAALLPLLVGIIAVIGTNASLKGLSSVTDVSIFSVNLATGLSLGLAADYGLFIVRRYREELRKGADTPTAIRTTLNTAGRTVAFSSLTVAVAVSSMLIFPLYFLRSFAYAGVSVVILAALAALITLPAGLVALGKYVDALDISRVFLWVGRRLRGRREPAAPGSGWRKMAEAVMRRPVIYALLSIAFLLLLGAPFLHVNFGLPDDRLLPKTYESHVVQQALRDDFDSRPTGELDVVATGVQPQSRSAAINDYAIRLSTLDKVVRVQALTGTYQGGRQVGPADQFSSRFANGNATYLAVTSTAEDISSESQDLVHRVRAVPAPFQVRVAGTPADLVDAKKALVNRLPWAIAIIAATTLVLIFLLTGSVLIPIKALLMNTLSLSATFGALVWIFQDYHLSSILNFQQTGWVDVTLLVLLFCVAFGVSMDYEVFLLSRIKEEYARTGDNRSAVVYGIEKTGGVVTAAALITSIVFIAMGTSRVTNIKMFGVGLALAMLTDASIVRTVLVPALMRLAGKANWWAPAPLRWVYNRFGLREGGSTAEHEESRDVPSPALPVSTGGHRA